MSKDSWSLEQKFKVWIWELNDKEPRHSKTQTHTLMLLSLSMRPKEKKK